MSSDYRVTDMNLPAAVGNGDVCIKQPEAPAVIHISGTFNATLQLQVSTDGTVWINDGAVLTVPGLLKPSCEAVYLRVAVTVYTSGTPVGKVLVRI